jgi:tRNA-specific 2-thiouridylase
MVPLGDVPSKEVVRAEAAARGLGLSAKPDSYDICFVADGDTAGFLRTRLGSAPGPVVDGDGAVLGEHDGAYAYTVGQRRGLRLGRPAPDGRARYVLEVRPATRTVVVGPVEALAVTRLVGRDVVWLAPDVRADRWSAADVQVRAHGAPVAALVRVEPGGAGAGPRLVAELAEPLRGVAAGQSAVVYAGSRVLGQATVESAARARGAV